MIEAIVFDLDGTVYVGNTMVPGAEDALEKLRAAGKKLFFLSNAATKSRAEQAQKMLDMGLKVSPAEVYNSAYAVASYISENHPKKTVYALAAGMRKELEAKGIKLVDGEDAEKRAQIVAVGLDRDFSFQKLAIASRAIRNGALFIASNTDATYPTERGPYPGAGSIVAAVQVASGKAPSVVLGKPSTYVLEEIAKEHNLKRERMLIVGDRPETDILAAKNFGIKSVAVLTGVLTAADIKKMKKKDRPDYTIASVRELPELVAKLG